MKQLKILKLITLCVFFCITFCQYSCNGCGEILGEICFREYSINIPFEITPDESLFQTTDSVIISMFIPNNSIDNITNDTVNLRNLNYDVDIRLFQLNEENKEILSLSLEEFSFDSDMVDGGVNRIGETENTTGNLLFEDSIDGRICLFKFTTQISGLLGLAFEYNDELLNESDRHKPRLDLSETCCIEEVIINNVKIGGEKHNFHLIDNDTLGWTSNGLELNLTDEDFLRSGIFLFVVE